MENTKAKKTKDMQHFQDLTEARALHDLIKIIHLIGNTSAKIHGVLDKDEIFKILIEEFRKSKHYTLSILLLTDDRLKLRIAKTSLAPERLKAGEKIAGVQLRGHEIDLNKSDSYSQVVKKGKIIQVNVGDLIHELFPQPIAFLISKTMGSKNKNCILVPLYQDKNIMGVIAVSSTQLFEYFIPLVKNFAHHISQALELADGNTWRKQIEKILSESERRLRNILASSPDAITVTDLDGNITECNQATLNMHGFSSKRELIGKSAFELIAEKDHQRALENMKKTLKQGFLKDIEYTFLTKNGREFPAELSASVIRDSSGNPTAFIAITKNIFKRKQAAHAKSEFVSIASHQLRTPLSIMNWYSEMLLDGKAGKLNNQQGKYLEEIYEASQRLTKSMNLLLNASRIELGILGVNPEPINLGEIVDSVLSEFFLEIRNKNVKVEKDYGKKQLIINADPDIIRIIFQNLLSNAIKYLPKRGKVRVFIEKQNSSALIKVSDNGYGIPGAQQPKIFTKFFRASNAKEKEPDGAGLGLYIVKLILEKSGGKIWFESEENKGTTFYLRIPLNKA